MDVKFNATIHNRFDLEVIDSRTGEVRQRAQAENVICNGLWSRRTSSLGYFSYIHYGTGAGTPAAADTQLFSFLGALGFTTNSYTMNEACDTYARQRMAQMAENVAVGATLTEVGVAYDNRGATLVTHAMLRDMNGNPMTITKTATDVINIYATIYLHWNADGYDNGTIRITGRPQLLMYLLGCSEDERINYVRARAPEFIYLSYGKGHGYETAYGYQVEVRRWTATPTFNAATKRLTIKMDRQGVDTFNNIRGFTGFHFHSYWSANDDKTEQEATLQLIVDGGSWFSASQVTNDIIGTGDGVTTHFSTTFPEVSDAAIYINGVLQTSGVTVDKQPRNTGNMGYEFDCINAAGVKIWSAKPIADLGAIAVNSTRYFYNRWWELGIASFYARYVTVWGSDDLENWTELKAYSTAAATVQLAAGDRNYKYWKVQTGASSAGSFYTLTADCLATNVHFDVAPPAGATIKADYTTACVAKDANHVFDLTVTMQLAEA